jgi:tetratricopeptide (TPR) repeat protein
MTDPSPDLSELEMAFAKDPSRFLALSSAYLQQGRYMEAMVVCKKGIKSQPDSVEGRLLLARVYAEQGKLPKAVEEVKALLAQRTDVAEAHFVLAQLHDKAGRGDDAVESLKEALRQNPRYADATAALKAKGIDFQVGPTPEEIAAAKAAEEASRRAEEAARAAVAAAAAEDEQARRAVVERTSPTRPSPPAAGSLPSQAPMTPAGAPGPTTGGYQGYYGAGSYGYGAALEQTRGKRFGFGFTFGLGALLLLVVVGIIFVLSRNKSQKEEMAGYMRAAQKSYARDTTLGHKQALEKLQAALAVDDEQPMVAGQLALSLETLVVDRGMKDLEAQAKTATDHADKVAHDQVASVAARMLAARGAGDANRALAIGDEFIAKLGADKAPPFVVAVEQGRAYAALGRIPDMLKIAGTLANASDANALTFAGEAYRRVGDRARARFALDGAIRVEPDHDPARALRALAILESDDVSSLDFALDDVRHLGEMGKDALGPRQRGYAVLARALLARRAGRAKEADMEMKDAEALLRGDPELKLFEAKRLLSGREDRSPGPAQAAALEAIKLDRFRLEPYLVLATAAGAAKDWTVADKALDDATGIFGSNLEIVRARAERLSLQERYDDARKVLDDELKKKEEAELYLDIGKVLLRKQDVPGAVEQLKKAAEKATNKPTSMQAQIYTMLGRALAANSDHENAIEAYNSALKASPSYTNAHYYLGVSLAAEKQTGAARTALETYLRNDPGGPLVDRARRQLESL